jgi:ATP phosphoribosyltransferase
MPNRFLTIALSKGRLFTETLPLLVHAGIAPADDPERSRKLIIDTNLPDVRLVLIRAADVPTYVEHGAADLGVTGKDVLMEHGGEGVYEPLDLGISRCRMMVAGPDPVRFAVVEDIAQARRLRVATKYVNTTRRYYAAQGVQVEIIKLYGSMELAPLAGLADRIVDLVDTGNTLRANGLIPLERVADISARLIVNRAAMKMKHARVKEFVRRMAEAVERHTAARPPESAKGQDHA